MRWTCLEPEIRNESAIGSPHQPPAPFSRDASAAGSHNAHNSVTHDGSATGSRPLQKRFIREIHPPQNRAQVSNEPEPLHPFVLDTSTVDRTTGRFTALKLDAEQVLIVPRDRKRKLGGFTIRIEKPDRLKRNGPCDGFRRFLFHQHCL